jgi:hypothetical protein
MDSSEHGDFTPVEWLTTGRFVERYVSVKCRPRVILHCVRPESKLRKGAKVSRGRQAGLMEWGTPFFLTQFVKNGSAETPLITNT